MNRRNLMKGVGAAVAMTMATGLSPARATLGLLGGGAAAAPHNQNYLGANVAVIDYFTPEQPFLNLFKQANANSAGGVAYTWFVDGTTTNPNLLLDSDGNVTSMIDSQGTTHTKILTWMNEALNAGSLPPFAASLYPTGTYRLVFSGPGTGYVARDMTIPTQTAPSGVTISGNSFTSTLAIGQSASITVQVSSATTLGIEVGVTSLANDGVNYIKFISLVQSAHTSLYDAGQIFHPDFLQQLAYASRVRFMEWQWSNAQEQGFNFTADLAVNATSGVLASSLFKGYISGTTLTVTAWTSGQYTSLNGLALVGAGVTGGTTVTAGSGNSWTVSASQTVGSSSSPVQMATELVWAAPSGTYTFVFANGQAIANVVCTHGQSGVTWTTPLSSLVSSSTVYGWMASWSRFPTWAARPKMSNFTWGGAGGVPYEVQALLCNALNIDGWFNIPIGANYVDSTFASSLASLLFSGSGAALSGPVTSFAGLSGMAYVELSNEVWNGTFNSGQCGFSQMVGQKYIGLPGTNYNQYYAGQEFYGVEVAAIGDAFYGVYGAAMASRVVVSMGAQTTTGNGPAFLAAAMNTPDAPSAAYTHHIAGVHFAPYFYLLAKASGASTTQYQTDLNTIAALPDPVGEAFSLAYSNVGTSGNTYSSLPTNGYVRGSGTSIATLSTLISTIRANGFAWANIKVYGYEGGEDTVVSSSNFGFTPSTAVITMFEDVYRDSRMQYLYYDSGHVLSSNPGYLVDLGTTAGMTNLNIYNDVQSNTNASNWAQYGDQGQLENTEQLPTITSAPGKWLGCDKFAKAA